MKNAEIELVRVGGDVMTASGDRPAGIPVTVNAMLFNDIGNRLSQNYDNGSLLGGHLFFDRTSGGQATGYTTKENLDAELSGNTYMRYEVKGESGTLYDLLLKLTESDNEDEKYNGTYFLQGDGCTFKWVNSSLEQKTYTN